MNRIVNAVDKYNDGYACSQAILSEYSALFDLNPDIALKLASGFAGGMRMGRTCGAVTGAYMVLGLRFGDCNCSKIEGRQYVYRAVCEFTRKFKEIYGSTDCMDLLDYDISTKQGSQAVKEQNPSRTHCSQFIETSGRLLEQFIDKT
jgi:C_GCAxxG_C_C family probable redox protein